MSEQRTKSNKKFMLLSAIGIFMVVDSHTFTALNLFGNFIPYNSFFMPMFVFISGYFNKVDASTNLWTYFKKKVRKLLVPYMGITLTVLAIQQLINWIKLGDEFTSLPPGFLAYMLDNMITSGVPFAIVTPMWFVIALFATLMVYALLKKFLYKIWNSYVFLAIFCCLHILAVYIARNVDLESAYYLLLPLKCMFMFPFLEMGTIYKNVLEKKHESLPGGGKVALMLILLVINAIRTLYMPNPYDLAFDSIDYLTGFTSPYIVTPLISSIVGILFWITFVDLLGKQVGESRFINYMSCNTFYIMGFHILFFNILNLVLLLISRHIAEIPYFDVETFEGTEWYFWEIGSNAKILYVVAGVLGPLGIKWVFDKIYAFITKKAEAIKGGLAKTENSLKVLNIIKYALIIALAAGLFYVWLSSKIESNETEHNDGEEDYEAYADTGLDEDNEAYADAGLNENNEAYADAGLNENNEAYADAGLDEDSESNASPTDENNSSEISDGDGNTGTNTGTPAYAFLNIAYEHMGGYENYFTDFEEIYSDGTYTVTLKRGDDEFTPDVFDGFSYMAIKLTQQLSDAQDVDISEAEINDVNVICDGRQLTVLTDGTITMDGDKCIFFDCYDEGTDISEADEPGTVPVYDFNGKNEIIVRYTISGIKKKG